MTPSARSKGTPLPALLGLLALLALLLIGSVAWFVQIYDRRPTNGTLDFEIAKTLLQIGVVSVAAALVALLAKHYERSVERQQRTRDANRTELRYREDLLKETVRRITAAYNQAKKARRKMRARGTNRSATPRLIVLAHYDECMAELNDAQLELETIIQDVRTNHEAFPSAKAIRAALKSMEDYLAELNGEYEKKRPRCGPEVTEVPFDEMEWMSDFTGKAKTRDAEGNKVPSQFKRDFAKGHSEARKAINQDLLTLTSAKRALS